jgi:hypothetical protein
MVLEYYLPPKLIVFHNNKMARMPPMVVFRLKWEAGRKVLDCMCKEVLYMQNLVPQSYSRNLAKKQVVRKCHNIFIVIQTIIIIMSL